MTDAGHETSRPVRSRYPVQRVFWLLLALKRSTSSSEYCKRLSVKLLMLIKSGFLCCTLLIHKAVFLSAIESSEESASLEPSLMFSSRSSLMFSFKLPPSELSYRTVLMPIVDRGRGVLTRWMMFGESCKTLSRAPFRVVQAWRLSRWRGVINYQRD